MNTIPQDNTPRKQCTGPECNQWLPATTEFFYAAKKSKDGLTYLCKNCTKQRAKAHSQRPEVQEQRKLRDSTPEAHAKGREIARQRYAQPETREKIREQSRRHCWKPGVRERVLEYSRQPEVQARHRIRMRNHSNNPDYRAKKRLYDLNYRSIPEVRARIAAYRRVYQQQYIHRPEVRTRKRAHDKRYYYQLRSKPELLARKQVRHQSWHRAYSLRPEIRERRRRYSRVYNHLRRARQRSIPGTYTHEQIQDLLKRQKYRCYYAACGYAKFQKKGDKHVYHIDHTYPISRVIGAGIPANDISYLVLTCPSCNQRKNDKFPWEWPEGGRLL